MAPISVTLAPRDPPAAVVALAGEHDAYSAGRLDNELGVLLGEGRLVVLARRAAHVIDSATLGAIRRDRQRAGMSGLCCAHVLARHYYTQVHHLLDLTG